MSALEVKRTKVYGDLNFVTDLAQLFCFPSSAPLTLLSSPVARAGRRGFSDPRSFLP